MQPSQNAYLMLSREEGLVLHPYRDSRGIPTIGYGCCFYPDGRRVMINDPPITQQTAWNMMVTLGDRFAGQLSALIRVPVTQYQFDALFDFCYNMGVYAFSRSTMLRKLNGGDYSGTATEFLRWDPGMPALQRRHSNQRRLFLIGQYA